jgi:hypothetical protein
MYHLIYVSSAVDLFSDAQLQELLKVSRANNSKCDVTGMLLYVDGNFIQVLEGEEEVVTTTHLRIARDPRHHGMLVLLQGEIAQRDFVDWSMGFRKVEADDGRDLPGYSDFLLLKTDPEKQRSSVLRLLDHFKNINR